MTERTIFLAALDIDDAAERDAYVERACDGDAGLRRGFGPRGAGVEVLTDGSDLFGGPGLRPGGDRRTARADGFGRTPRRT